MRGGACRPIRCSWLALLAGVGSVLVTRPVDAVTRPIPEVVDVTVFARQQERQLDLLVRVPLAALREIEFPTRGAAGYLDLAALRTMLPGAARYWIANGFDVLEDGVAVVRPDVAGAHISISADQSFDSYEQARARFVSPDVAADDDLLWQQVWLDVRLLYALSSSDRRVAISPRLAALGVRVSTRMTVVDAAGHRSLSFDGDPGLIYLDPHWIDVAGPFLLRGIRVLLGRADLLLMLSCLVLPFQRFRPIVPAALTFTSAFILALAASAAGLTPGALWFRPLIDTFTAAAVLLAACANIAGAVTPRRRALLALGAGAVSGVSCAFVLRTVLQFGGPYVVTSQVCFGAGVVIAMAATVALFVPVVSFLFSFARTERLERIIVSALAADTAWGWLADRWEQLRKVPWQGAFEASATAALSTMAVVVLAGGVVWAVNEWLKSHGFAEEAIMPPSKRETPA